ncbi:MAG: PEP-CTERM sorting domain-containing protein [Planctomycetes bacterium]|nr:PEP-CTERM sorting domain-containing protein [Planctomycetota bacterium]
MKRVATVLALTALLITTANASASIILNSLAPVSENFDTLINTGSTPLSATIGTQVGLGNGWDGVKNSGTGASAMALIADTGTGNSGALYSYGNAAGNPERALGAVGSGSNAATFGVEIVNNTGVAITSIFISATAEFWRSSTSSSGTPNTLTFGWGLSGGSSNSANYLTDVGSSNVLPGLNVVGPTPVTTNGALDGNLPANQAAISGMILTTLNPGASLFIRWMDVNDQGNDAGLAIDNLNIEVTPEPSTLALLGLGAVALLRRRK